MDIAIAVFSFRRPDKLRLVLEALRGAKVAKLYHFCDGPRNAADEQLCAENRQIAQSVDTEIPTEYQLREKNIGLTQNLIGGIDHVLSKHEAIIVLEDDIVPTPQFFSFMYACLQSHREQPDIFSIAGYHPLSLENTPDEAAFLSPRFFCWGWATWTEKWKKISLKVKSGNSPYPHYWLVPDTAGTDLRWGVRSWKMGKKDLVWDQLVALHTLALGLNHVCPQSTLISNIGFDGSGEHCPPSDSIIANPATHNKQLSGASPLKPNTVVFRNIAALHKLPESSWINKSRRRLNYSLKTQFRRILKAF
jgi:hypothetical protein